MGDFDKVADVKGEAKFDKSQTWFALGGNAGMSLLNGLSKGFEKYLNYSLMNGMIDLQRDQMTQYFGLQGRLVDLNGALINSQEKVALKQMTTTKEIAELQKERDVAVARTRADAAVKIAKVNALNAQFYGQPNQLPSLS